jgi:multidrug efflux pump subunit AcrA (membrane-fusion protein)
MRKLALIALLVAVPLIARSRSEHSYMLRLDNITFMNGQGISSEELKQLEATYGKRFFWFQRDGHSYVVKNAGALDRAEAIVAPQAELGRKQGTLGQKQAALGSKQAALGARQAELGAKQAAAARDERQQEELSRRQEVLSGQQEVLSKQQDQLGQQQDKLSKEQDRLSMLVEQQLDELAGRCIRDGQASEVRW